MRVQAAPTFVRSTAMAVVEESVAEEVEAEEGEDAVVAVVPSEAVRTNRLLEPRVVAVAVAEVAVEAVAMLALDIPRVAQDAGPAVPPPARAPEVEVTPTVVLLMATPEAMVGSVRASRGDSSAVLALLTSQGWWEAVNTEPLLLRRCSSASTLCSVSLFSSAAEAWTRSMRETRRPLEPFSGCLMVWRSCRGI